jgi:phenylacetic acid degradation operon negative regulatory protein
VAPSPSPGSLILSFYGAYGRAAAGGAVPVAGLVRLLGTAGVDAPSVRSAVSRLKRRGLLVSRRTAGGAAAYAPSPAALQLLEDGDRRIYGPAPADGGWLLVVFTVPESERRRRHVLRSQLARLGFGNAAPGVWIAPAHVEEETRHTLGRLELDAYVDLFRGTHAGFPPTTEAVARWWDLAALAGLHHGFLDACEPLLRSWSRRSGTPPRDAFRDYLPVLDAWRRLPYADPGLPAALLPPDWPGGRSARVFARLDERLRGPGGEHAAEVLRATG